MANFCAKPVSHYMWREDHSFDDEADHLSIETLNGEQYVFDIESGELISGSLPDWADRVPLAGIAAPVLFVLLGSTLFVYVKRKRRQVR